MWGTEEEDKEGEEGRARSERAEARFPTVVATDPENTTNGGTGIERGGDLNAMFSDPPKMDGDENRSLSRQKEVEREGGRGTLGGRIGRAVGIDPKGQFPRLQHKTGMKPGAERADYRRGKESGRRAGGARREGASGLIPGGCVGRAHHDRSQRKFSTVVAPSRRRQRSASNPEQRYEGWLGSGVGIFWGDLKLS